MMVSVDPTDMLKGHVSYMHKNHTDTDTWPLQVTAIHLGSQVGFRKDENTAAFVEFCILSPPV